MSQNAYHRKCKRRRYLRDNRGQSQYITVMLLFSLGLAMVVAVNFLFEGLTESVQDTVARERLEEFTINVRDKIVQTIAIGQQSGQNSQVRTELHLPTKIGTKYDFEITLLSTSADNSDWIIASRVINADTVLRFAISLRVDGSRVTLDGSFSSTASQHFIIFRSSSRSGLSLDQCVLVDA
ncbi:MAG: hypothetical protein ACXADX_02255 [Candidatus Hodarchaeales archaeon]